MRKEKKLIWTGVLAAIGSSLCCITPLLALVSGATGLASAFTWVEPLRPYLILITFAVLGFAWYQKLKPKKEMACACDEEKPSFFQSKSYLGLMTIFAILMLGFPYLSQSFYRTPSKQVVVVDKANVQKVDFDIEGMTCTSCEAHINHAVNELDGIIRIQTSYESGHTTIEFDESQTNLGAIKEAIASTGYALKNK